MPDLVGDPRLANVNQPSGPNPLHDDDPSNDDQYEAWKANADLWREWAGRQDEAIARLVQQGAAAGQTPEQTLGKAGFKNAKEQGQHAYTMYGTGGYYSQQGAAADPGWRYDWNTGLKYNMGTDDLSARTRGVPINANEYAERAKSQQYAAQGINDYGSQANAEAFKKAVAAGHFRLDPRTGSYYSGSSPTDPGNNWVDKFGRALKGGPQGQPSGQSFNGSPMPTYGASGYGGGYDSSTGAFGGGFGPGFTPGGEASNFAQADLNAAMAEGMRNDILSQQIQLQKNLEGHALGQGMYDYLSNEVYGPILGARFQGNAPGVSQYTQGLQQGTPNQFAAAYGGNSSASYPGFQGPTGGLTWQSQPGDVPRDVNGNPLPGAKPGDTWGEQAPSQKPEDQYGRPGSPVRVPGTGAPKDYGSGNEVAGLRAASDFSIQGGPSELFDESKGTVPSYRGGEPGMENIMTLGGKGSGPGNIFTDFGKQAGQAAENAANGALQKFEEAIKAGQMTPEMQKAFQQLQQSGGQIPPELAQRYPNIASSFSAYVQQKAGRPVQALGTPLPKGSYTQTGTDAFDPNLNQSWARFIAPTMNQAMQSTDQQMEQIRRQMPRGGGQDRAVSDAINQRYGAMQQGWQSLVPTALQGVSDIAKEMYFQQPAQNSGAMGTAGSLAAANQQYNLGLKQIASNEKVADTQAGAAKWGAVGNALGGLTSLISPFKLFGAQK